jgi:hypothetical protein
MSLKRFVNGGGGAMFMDCVFTVKYVKISLNMAFHFKFRDLVRHFDTKKDMSGRYR